jgi:hypothetical protein
MKSNTWGHIQREWGFEVRVDVTDDSGKIHNEVIVFDKEPQPDELTKKVDELQLMVAARPLEIVAETVDQKDVEISSLKEQLSISTETLKTVIAEKEVLLKENVTLKKVPTEVIK